MTVKQAIAELGVGKSTTYRWIRDSEGTVPRRRYRLPNAAGKYMLTLVVDIEALREYGDTQIPGRPPTT